MYTRVHKSIYARICTYISIYLYIRMCIHTYIHTYIHGKPFDLDSRSFNVCQTPQVGVSLHENVYHRARARVCCVYIYIYIHTYIHTRICAYMNSNAHRNTCKRRIFSNTHPFVTVKWRAGQALATIESSLRKHSDQDTTKDSAWNLVSEADPWSLLFAEAFSDRAKHVVHARFSDMQVEACVCECVWLVHTCCVYACVWPVHTCCVYVCVWLVHTCCVYVCVWLVHTCCVYACVWLVHTCCVYACVLLVHTCCVYVCVWPLHTCCVYACGTLCVGVYVLSYMYAVLKRLQHIYNTHMHAYWSCPLAHIPNTALTLTHPCAQKQNAKSRTHTVDYRKQDAKSRTHTVDYRRQNAKSRTHTVDYRKQDAKSRTHNDPHADRGTHRTIHGKSGPSIIPRLRSSSQRGSRFLQNASRRPRFLYWRPQPIRPLLSSQNSREHAGFWGEIHD
jgi:hypothetical protein